MTRLDRIRKRLNAATPGPWMYVPDELNPISGYPEVRTADDRFWIAFVPYGPIPDGDFIAHAPADIRDLLAVAEAARPFADTVTCLDGDDCPHKVCTLNRALGALDAEGEA